MVAIEPSGTESNDKVTRTQGDNLFEAAKISSNNLKRMEKPSAKVTKTFKQPKLMPSIATKLARSSDLEVNDEMICFGIHHSLCVVSNIFTLVLFFLYSTDWRSRQVLFLRL